MAPITRSMKLQRLLNPTWWRKDDQTIVVNNTQYGLDSRSDRDLPMHSRGSHQVTIDEESKTAFVTRGNKYSGG